MTGGPASALRGARGRIRNDQALTLSRRPLGEADLLAVVYTRELGRLRVRFAGARRPAAKLKALAEPFVRAELRLYMRPGAAMAKGVGGALHDTYPAIREDLDRTFHALAVCELLERLTPEGSPNPAKFDLAVSALEALSRRASPWVVTVFGLRLLALAGWSPAPHAMPEEARGIRPAWDELPLDDLGGLPAEPGAVAAWRRSLAAQVEAQTGREFKSLAFLGRRAA